MFHFKPRFKNVRPFVGINTREGGRNGGIQIGVTTYDTDQDGNETYQVSYVEWAGRSDHIADAVCEATGVEVDTLLVSDSKQDVVYVGTLDMNKPKALKAEAV